MSKTAFMRGLQNFISDIRACQTKEQEQRRVEKELFKIREKFMDDKGLNGYDRRKYVWKLLYCYMLGYDIDFGLKQAADLIPMPKYKDKQVGYMACSLLLRENEQFLSMIINGIKMDLNSRNEAFECLALNFVGSVGGREMAEALTQDILRLLTNGASRPLVKKRAALCLLKMMRKTAHDQPVVDPHSFCSIMGGLLEEQDLGLMLSSMTLFHGILSRNGPGGYETLQGKVIKVLERLLSSSRDRNVQPEYLYYAIPAPWLQCKALRVLQFFPSPEVPADRASLHTILQAILNSTATFDAPKGGNAPPPNANKSNAIHSIMFEAVALMQMTDIDRAMQAHSISTLMSFVASRDSNIRFLSLEAMCRMTSLADMHAPILTHRATLYTALRDLDIAIRVKSVELLYGVCDQNSVVEIVGELQQYLVAADNSMRDDIVYKIGSLAEKFAPSVQWYIDVVLQLLERAGDLVSEDVWHRVVDLARSNPPMQAYAARSVVTTLKRSSPTEPLVSTSAYILGEHGVHIRGEVPSSEQFRLLNGLFPPATQQTKGLLVTAMVKVYLAESHNPHLRQECVSMFERCQQFMESGLQQMAAEFIAVSDQPQAANMTFPLPMPRWPDVPQRAMPAMQGNGGLTAVGGSVAERHGSSSNASTPSFFPGPSSGPAPFMGSSSLGAAHPPPPPTNQVDLLSDLLGDSLVVSAPAPQPQGGLYYPPVYGAPQPPPGGVNYALPAAQQQYDPFAPAPVAAAGAAAMSYGGGPPPAYGAPPSHAAQTSASYSSAAPSPHVMAPPGPLPVADFYSPPSQAYNDQGPNHAAVAGIAAGAGYAAGAAASSNPFDDPFGDNAFQAAPPPPPPMPTFEAAVLAGDLEEWYTALLVKPRGIIYEDQYLQVGVQSSYTQSQGVITFFLGNKNKEQALNNILVAVTSPSSSVEVSVGGAPVSLAPGQQMQVAMKLVCLGPIEEAPAVRLGYTLCNIVVAQELRLPVANHRFMAPEAHIAKELFFEQWKALANPPTKAQEMFERVGAIKVETIASVLQSASLGVEHGYLDPSPYNEAGAAYFLSQEHGHEKSTLVLCRAEGNPQTMCQFRVTVESPSPVLAAYVKEQIVMKLRDLSA